MVIDTEPAVSADEIAPVNVKAATTLCPPEVRSAMLPASL
jgi:hypothetical protein